MRGYYWMLRYNLGSLLFGSFLIALVWIVRIVYEYIERKIKAEGANIAPPIAFLLKIFKCCLDCCNRFVKYINQNAYCQVVLTGEPFCIAAVSGFLLILKHAATFGFTKGVGGLFNMLGKLVVSVGNVTICYFILTFWPEEYEKINSPIGPLIIVFIISYIIATLFMSLYDNTSTCILHCLYADIDICKQLNYDETNRANRPAEMTDIVALLSSSSMAKPLIA